jgi:ribosomal protein L7Ae-like RNA K-turn-binding protein
MWILLQIEKIERLLGLALRARGLLVGSRETRSGLHAGQVYLVLLAADGSPRDRERLLRICAERSVPVHALSSRAEMGGWLGREEVAVVGVKDSNLATAFTECLASRSAAQTGEKPEGEK